MSGGCRCWRASRLRLLLRCRLCPPDDVVGGEPARHDPGTGDGPAAGRTRNAPGPADGRGIRSGPRALIARIGNAEQELGEITGRRHGRLRLGSFPTALPRSSRQRSPGSSGSMPQQLPQSHQLGAVAQQRPQLADSGRATHASGSRSARGSCPEIAAPALSFFSRPRRLPCTAMDAPGAGQPVVLQQPRQPAGAVRGPGRRGARRQATDRRQDRLCPIGRVAVGEHFPTGVDDCQLAALEARRRCRQTSPGLLPRARMPPGASRYRAEQGRGPASRPAP